MQRPWMPFYIGDYLCDTLHLSTLQHGLYLLLILHYWMNSGLPDDDQELANIVHLPLDEWLLHRPVLKRFFYDGWKHKRVERELKKMIETSIKRAAAGSKGGTIAMINRYRKK